MFCVDFVPRANRARMLDLGIPPREVEPSAAGEQTPYKALGTLLLVVGTAVMDTHELDTWPQDVDAAVEVKALPCLAEM